MHLDLNVAVYFIVICSNVKGNDKNDSLIFFPQGNIQNNSAKKTQIQLEVKIMSRRTQQDNLKF